VGFAGVINRLKSISKTSHANPTKQGNATFGGEVCEKPLRESISKGNYNWSKLRATKIHKRNMRINIYAYYNAKAKEND
jgi:hypothetical protein